MENEQNKKTILVVENDVPTSDAIIAKLTLRGFNTLKADDGAKGVKMAIDYHPDLILLDILMPNIDGLEAMKQIREEGTWGKSVPIFLLTNLSPDEERIMKGVTRDEPAYYLIKTNFNLDDVVDKIKEKLNL